MVPKGANPKFFKKWRGNFTVVKRIGNLNLLVRASPHSKPTLVHLDRVKHMHVNDQLVKFNPDAGMIVKGQLNIILLTEFWRF